MLVSKEKILSVIPQRSPIVMVETLLHCDETTTRSGFQVSNENIFTEEGMFREPGLVENIAQTAAAGVGYAAQQKKEPVPIGYIGAVQNLEIFDLPKVGDYLETEVAVTNKVFDVTFVNGSIRTNGNLLAQCEMKIFITKQS